jgi:hypothetical protein
VAAHPGVGTRENTFKRWDLDFALKASIDWAEPGFCVKKSSLWLKREVINVHFQTIPFL